MTRRRLALLAALAALALAPAARPADAVSLRLVVKPLLCVLDKTATSCRMTFDIRWKSAAARDLCLSETAKPAPLKCWERTTDGAHADEREVAEDFSYWLGSPASAEHLAEVKISVLKLESTDRRRERRSRHVWDVL